MKIRSICILFFTSIASIIAQDVSEGSTETIAITTDAVTTNAVTTDAITTTATPTVATTSDMATTTIDITTTADPVTTTTSSSAAAATTTTAAVDLSDCLNADAFTDHDYFPNKLDFSKLDSTAQFNVTYYNTYKLVHNLVLDEYYVLHCTKSAPSLGNTFQSKTFVQIPVRSFAAIDTRALGYLDLLGQSNNVAFVGNTSNITSPCGTNTPAYFNLSDPNLDRTKYDLAIYSVSSNNDPKGVGFGINYNNSPLGNAQWIKYIALFTNQETEADTIYNNILTDYNTFRDSINAAGSVLYKRNITFMNYDPSSTKFNILQDTYFQNLTSDAGAVLLKPHVLQPGDPSVMKEQLQNSSVVIDLTPDSAFGSTYNNWQSWLGYSDDKISSAEKAAFDTYQQTKKYINSYDAPPFARNKQLWRFDLITKEGALDYWTRGMARPDLLLQDLIQVQFPGFFKSRSRVFLRSFADNNESSRTASSSPDSYQCNLRQWEKAASVSYQNSDSDIPALSATSNKMSLGLIIGVSVAGGMVALACLATVFVLIKRKMKDGNGKRFTRLNDETMDEFGALDKDPMMPTTTETSRFGGSSRGF
ncbi:uncharacterized protein BX663DRAFT_513651 [Cokeromyces recurvatus]|uniref:uncharacterized protein n=1 Tax=Cokeromyces recurvatus TaxID=90255 RepID=UPI00221F9B31|nr:uncharacterized protein BX663DRAFT_513651 [Cokeromyces recurvatus]KAI7901676.1 hypothetical protein BX663DRAFT_513651 [Cokeromyces recurvatus]